ncbi:MAG TPA: SDR family oxidoreductase [Candidatus Elarobacter sp.]|nr:SDR family oxidoreductase [Candidatus Elarobacter sp.]HEV2740718.1 SDR family oxidoreductase [Candidatus Elarobacter sp.]
MSIALITGASSGIGEAFARALAARGEDLVLVARSAERLEALAAGLSAEHGVQAHVLPADLSDPKAVDALVAELTARELPIATLINNAGFGTHGEFASLDAARERDEVLVNVLAPVQLTRALLPAMIARESGAIVNVGSTASFQPVPYMAVYGATKAFLLSFSEALAEEVRAHGVRVVALCPGQTDTAFFDGIDEARVGRARTTQQVVATALRALKRGNVVAVDGFANYALANATRLAPRRFVARVAASIQRPRWLR